MAYFFLAGPALRPKLKAFLRAARKRASRLRLALGALRVALLFAPTSPARAVCPDLAIAGNAFWALLPDTQRFYMMGSNLR